MLRERAQTPLVGSEAPEFTAEAVFDQEFVTLSLSQYRVRMRPLLNYPSTCPAQHWQSLQAVY
jgi:peroxiredoxin (alkyl hydroperoxide reductase subunit C)